MGPKKFFYSMLAVCAALIVLLGVQFAVPGSTVAMQALSVPTESCEGAACSNGVWPVAIYVLFAAIIVFFVLLFVHGDLLKKE